ncbi:hypothetical protein Taro_034873 [Colocasia esculenta]|uniref:Uncharacterized protein n=1 Tax=Colocasia esculenta TaxID=4460 RepID=A0A843W8V3_COLES|nr:hypothetical protein [Colocasia esculenta]
MSGKTNPITKSPGFSYKTIAFPIKMSKRYKRNSLTVKSRVGLEMKQDLLLFSWSWRPGVAVDWLASMLVDVDCLNLAADHPRAALSAHSLPLLPQLRAPVSLKLLTGSEEWLDDRRTRGVAELHEETSRRGAIPVGARGGLGVNREIVGGSSVAGLGFLQGLWPENLASTSFVAKLLSQDVNNQVKSRVGPEIKQDLLLFSWSWRPGVAVDWLASMLVDVDCLNLAAAHPRAALSAHSLPLLPQLRAPVSLKLLTGSEEWLDDRRTRGIAELREETSRRGAIPVGARGGLGVNREIVGGSSVF